jgi:hypothetical protein
MFDNTPSVMPCTVPKIVISVAFQLLDQSWFE